MSAVYTELYTMHVSSMQLSTTCTCVICTPTWSRYVAFIPWWYWTDGISTALSNCIFKVWRIYI